MLWRIVAPDTISVHDVSIKILRRFRAGHSCPHHWILKKVCCAPSCFWVLWPTLFANCIGRGAWSRNDMQITWNAWRFATSPQKLTEALGKTSILRYHNLRFMRKILGIRRLGSSDMWKIEEVSSEMLVLSLRHVRFAVMSPYPCWGCQKIVMSFCLAGVALRDILMCPRKCQKTPCVTSAILPRGFHVRKRFAWIMICFP